MQLQGTLRGRATQRWKLCVMASPWPSNMPLSFLATLVSGPHGYHQMTLIELDEMLGMVLFEQPQKQQLKEE